VTKKVSVEKYPFRKATPILTPFLWEKPSSIYAFTKNATTVQTCVYLFRFGIPIGGIFPYTR
jgi:hypothetical protein